ncbi:MAG: class I SAM-dependent methyltransferase [Haloechinothrix sp.]
MAATHEERIEASFTEQARTVERADLNVAFTSGLSWLVELAAPAAQDQSLDVAGGTGLVARALAQYVESMTVVDVTGAMVDAGRDAAAAEGHGNVRFVHGDARSLPFPDRSFSLVLTRFSLHHFEDPGPVLDEIVRVTAGGGRIVVKDLVSSTDQAMAQTQDEIERLRDDSHVSMPMPGNVSTWLAERECQVLQVEQKPIDRPLDPWLEQSATPERRAEQVRSRLMAELDGGDPTGMRPHIEAGGVWFRQMWETTVARRP